MNKSYALSDVWKRPYVLMFSTLMSYHLVLMRLSCIVYNLNEELIIMTIGVSVTIVTVN